MPGFGDMVQKAFYLGVGLASLASEKAGGSFQELKAQAQKLAEELVARGEMTTEEARKFVDGFVAQGQPTTEEYTKQDKQPRPVEIIVEDESEGQTQNNADSLRQQVEALKEELRKLQQE